MAIFVNIFLCSISQFPDVVSSIADEWIAWKRFYSLSIFYIRRALCVLFFYICLGLCIRLFLSGKWRTRCINFINNFLLYFLCDNKNDDMALALICPTTGIVIYGGIERQKARSYSGEGKRKNKSLIVFECADVRNCFFMMRGDAYPCGYLGKSAIR